MPAGTTISGILPNFPTFLGSNNPKPSSIINGTVLVTRRTDAAIDANGRPTTEIIRQNRDTLIEEVAIYHDGQPAPTTGWAPVTTPWAVRAGRFADSDRPTRAERASMSDVYVLAFTHGVEYQRGGEGGHITRLRAHCFRSGLSLDGIHHCIRIESPDLFPNWSAHDAVRRYMQHWYEAYEVGRVDGLIVTGQMFSIWTKNGLKFIPSRSPD